MIDIEPLIVSGLERLAVPSGERADWQDVLQRAASALTAAGESRLFSQASSPQSWSWSPRPSAGDREGNRRFLPAHGPSRTEAPASERRAFDVAKGHSWALIRKGRNCAS